MSERHYEIRRMLNEAHSLPYGTARTTLAETLVRRIENEGPEEYLPEALLGLVEAHTFFGESRKAFVPYSKLLRLWDSRPELFDEVDKGSLFWAFKWIAGDLAAHPEISIQQAEAVLADMQRRYAVAGLGQQAPLLSRFLWLWQTGLPGADEAHVAWVKSTRDDHNDCDACILGHQVEYLVGKGRYEDAIRLGRTQQGFCNVEPMRTLTEMARAQLFTGDVEGAAVSHVAALAAHQASASNEVTMVGSRFELLARGGHLDRAMRELRDESARLEVGTTPLGRLGFLLHIIAGLSANPERFGEPTGLTNVEAETLGELRDWAHHEAGVLAEQFDTRSGTTHFADALARSMSATALGVLPLDEAPALEPELRLLPDYESGREETDFEAAERLANEGRYAAAAERYERAAIEAKEAGFLDRAGLAYAEAAACNAQTDSEQAAHRLFSKAVPLLRAGDAAANITIPVLTMWAPIATRLGETDALVKNLREVIDRWGSEEIEDESSDFEYRRFREIAWLLASAGDTLARTLASVALKSGDEAGLREAVDIAMEKGLDFGVLGFPDHAAYSFWLAARIYWELRETEDAQWSFEETLHQLRKAERRKPMVEVADEFIEFLNETGQPDKAADVAASLVE